MDDFFADKLLNCLILCKHKALSLLVAGKKAVVCDCHRKLHRFRQFQRKEVKIIDRLRRVCKKNDPSGVQQIHQVAVVAFDT